MTQNSIEFVLSHINVMNDLSTANGPLILLFFRLILEATFLNNAH